MEQILEMKQIVKDFANCRALDHVDFSIAKGETVAIIGPSGFWQKHPVAVRQLPESHYLRHHHPQRRNLRGHA